MSNRKPQGNPAVYRPVQDGDWTRRTSCLLYVDGRHRKEEVGCDIWRIFAVVTQPSRSRTYRDYVVYDATSGAPILRFGASATGLTQMLEAMYDWFAARYDIKLPLSNQVAPEARATFYEDICSIGHSLRVSVSRSIA